MYRSHSAAFLNDASSLALSSSVASLDAHLEAASRHIAICHRESADSVATLRRAGGFLRDGSNFMTPTRWLIAHPGAVGKEATVRYHEVPQRMTSAPTMRGSARAPVSGSLRAAAKKERSLSPDSLYLRGGRREMAAMSAARARPEALKEPMQPLQPRWRMGTGDHPPVVETSSTPSTARQVSPRVGRTSPRKGIAPFLSPRVPLKGLAKTMSETTSARSFSTMSPRTQTSVLDHLSPRSRQLSPGSTARQVSPRSQQISPRLRQLSPQPRAEASNKLGVAGKVAADMPSMAQARKDLVHWTYLFMDLNAAEPERVQAILSMRRKAAELCSTRLEAAKFVLAFRKALAMIPKEEMQALSLEEVCELYSKAEIDKLEEDYSGLSAVQLSKSSKVSEAEAVRLRIQAWLTERARRLQAPVIPRYK